MVLVCAWLLEFLYLLELGAMLTPPCPRMLRLSQNPIPSGPDAAIPGILRPRLGGNGRKCLQASPATSGQEVDAKSGRPSAKIWPNSFVLNILPTSSRLPAETSLLSHLVSASCISGASGVAKLTPYSPIFCKQVSASQYFTSVPRKIFKTNTLNSPVFNILRNFPRNLLQTEILFFYFFLRCFHHGSQDL